MALRKRNYQRNYVEKPVDMSYEVWRDVAGFEGCYQVSNYGRVKSVARVSTYIDKNGRTMPLPVKEKLIATSMPRFGDYKQCSLSKAVGKKRISKNKLVQQLVCTAFHGHAPQPRGEILRYVVDHKNGDKLNNRADNLRWASDFGNNMNKYNTNTMPKGENHHRAKLTESQVEWIKQHYQPRHPQYGAIPLAKKFNVHRTSIENAVRGATYNVKESRTQKSKDGYCPQIGENHYNAKIPAKDIPYIVENYIPRHKTFGAGAFARKYGVTRQCIGQIIRGKNRKSG